MPELDLTGTLDQPITNVDAGDQEISADVSSGEGAESGASSETGFEAVEGYEPPMPPPASESGLRSVGGEIVVPEGLTHLRDIGEASFGAPPGVPRTVHGSDDRVQINDTTSYPWRVHASLRITAADDSLWIGTAWFIGPRILVTAGHCVYITGSSVPGRNGWVKRVQVMPGRNGNSLPYGSVNSSSFWTVTGWAHGGDEEYDYGAIILSESLGNQTGWFGFGHWPNLNGVAGNISGYPGDKPAGTQWYEGRTIDAATARKVYYDIDTAGGQSGAAVYRFFNGVRYGYAIHAYGGAKVNSATRINSAVFNNLMSWKAAS